MMKTKKHFIAQVISGLSFLLLFCNFAQAETTNCTVITYLPYTISTPGIYCLNANLETDMTTGNAITINVNNVVIDLNSRKLGGGSAGAGTLATGIYAYQRKNITIKNGTVRGFYRGIRLHDESPFTTSQGHVVEDVRADMNTYIGILAYGRGNIVRNNQVVDTGGSTHSANPKGIYAVGPGARVINNDVYETLAQTGGTAYGIHVNVGDASVVVDNRVGNQALDAELSQGILIESSAGVTVKDNTVTSMDYGINYATGGTGLYMNNFVAGCPAAFTNGTAAGSTNYSIP